MESGANARIANGRRARLPARSDRRSTLEPRLAFAALVAGRPRLESRGRTTAKRTSRVLH